MAKSGTILRIRDVPEGLAKRFYAGFEGVTIVHNDSSSDPYPDSESDHSMALNQILALMDEFGFSSDDIASAISRRTAEKITARNEDEQE